MRLQQRRLQQRRLLPNMGFEFVDSGILTETALSYSGFLLCLLILAGELCLLTIFESELITKWWVRSISESA